MLRNLFLFLVVQISCLGYVRAEQADKETVGVELTIKHVAPGRWIANYEFDQEITKVDFGPARGQYRSQAWKILSDSVHLKREGRFEIVDTDGKSFRRLQIELSPYNAFPEGGYSPMNLFSDGGAAIYLHYFIGTAYVGGVSYEMQLKLQVSGLANENVISPKNNEQRTYLYFGPGKIETIADQAVIIDPVTPAWAKEVIEQSFGRLINTFKGKLGRELNKMSFLFSISPSQGEILSLKGGAIDGQIAMRFSGTQIETDSPQKRRLLEQILAHELAHLWQQDVVGGGSNPYASWVHEGGAELLAVAALRTSGIWGDEDELRFRQTLLNDCAKLGGDLKSYRGSYACGYQRQIELKVDPFALWKRLIRVADQTKSLYSEQMLQSVASELAEKTESR